MDVRCENCQTVYEFDDARLKEGGVNVKCTQCGHVFKVGPRQASARPRTLTGLRPLSDAAPAPRSVTLAPSLPAPSGNAGERSVREDTGPQRLWMLRSPGSTEIRRFRDLTTLQMWIVEGKAGPDDVLSRNGDRWQRIGSIGELEPFFRVVAQAQAAVNLAHGASATSVPRPPWRAAPAVDDAAWRATEPQLPTTPPPGKTPVVVPAVTTGRHSVDTPAPASEPPTPAQPADSSSSADSDEVDLLDDELPRRGPSARVMMAAAILCVGGAIGVYLVLHQRAVQRSQARQDEQRMREACNRGRAAFLLDSDEDLARAEGEFLQARAAGPGHPLPLAGLVELESTRARYLRDDAAGANPPGAIAPSDALEKSQARLVAARRYFGEVSSAARTDAYLGRALADLLVIEGAPAVQVEEALRRAEAQRSDDPEARYVRGLLALREGRGGEARTLLEQANQLSRSQSQRDLLRAKYLLAVQLALVGEKGEARAIARRIVEDNPRHARAARLLAGLGTEAAAAPTAVSAGAALAPVPTNAATTTAALTPAPTTAATGPAPAAVPLPGPARVDSPAGAADNRGPRGYAALCAAGNRLLENGRGREAVKMFEKALNENPHGVEAESGLGWALLDTEHYNAAADKFKQVLGNMPGNGEAIIGLAETYKLRGDHRHALEWYRRYVAELPYGSKAAMAQANVRELEDEAAKKERAAASESHETPPSPAPPSAAGR